MKDTAEFNFSGPNVLSDIVEQIVQVADPEKIILFGSRAKGTERKDSDYDICVLKKKIKKSGQWACKIRSAIDVLAPIDLIVITPNRYMELKNNIYYVYHDIETFGKVVYEKR